MGTGSHRLAVAPTAAVALGVLTFGLGVAVPLDGATSVTSRVFEPVHVSVWLPPR